MQINKLHVQPHSIATPKSRNLAQSGVNDTASGPAGARRQNLAFEIEAVKPYADQLKSIPEVRRELTEAARIRLASGEYTTRRAALETANAILDRS